MIDYLLFFMLLVCVTVCCWLDVRCKHKWHIISNNQAVNHNGDPSGRFFVLQCTKCGDVRKKELLRK